MPPGSQIPAERTVPALDIDQLLSGLRPVIAGGLNPRDVNLLTASLLEVFQGQGHTLESVLAKTTSFSENLADNNATVQLLIDNLNAVMATLANGDKFSEAMNRFEQLVTGLAGGDRDPIGAAIDSLSNGTASLAGLLTKSRQPLAATVNELNRLAPPLLDKDKHVLDAALAKAPNNYRKLVRLGAYGSWLNYYICSLSLRVSDLQGRTVIIPWVYQEDGRCAEL